MARYIDADKALEFIKETNANYHWLLSQYSASWVYDFIESQPTADVVPRTEVERLEGDLIIERTRRENAVNSYHLSKADGAREAIEEAISTLEEKCLLLVTSNGKYCFEKEEVMFWLRSVAYNLKKKYTEDKNDKRDTV